MSPPQMEDLMSWFLKSAILPIACLVIFTTQVSFALQTNINLSPYESFSIVMFVTMFLMCILTIHPLLLMIGLILTMFCEVVFIRDKEMNSSRLLYAGVLILTFGAIGLFAFVGVIWLWKKVPPGAVDIGPLTASIQKFIVQVLFIMFANGYSMICQWVALLQSENWHLHIVGNVLMYCPDSLWLSYCLLLPVHKIQLLHQNTARVQAVVPPSSDPV